MIRYTTAEFAAGTLIVYADDVDGECYIPATRKGVVYLHNCGSRHMLVKKPYTRMSQIVTELRWQRQ